MAGVSKETEVAAAAVRASSKCAYSSSSSRSSKSQGGRSGPWRRYPCQRRPRDCPLVYQPPASPLCLPIHPPPSPPPRVSLDPSLLIILWLFLFTQWLELVRAVRVVRRLVSCQLLTGWLA
ncbi:unnamed protein product [Prunus armeniaca]|uniref:Uncharacterized protein n=1 Tax=Prunus armeniaca TaxID=36596 RepID=A0A6J5TJH4_PRUAR|nr:unnamed protein product [Prunus armeniaca]CAB4294697.1 unnamed protein product [Prunus armeniaca]